MRSTVRRISAIDGIRGLAAMSVLAYHVWLTAGGWVGPLVSRGWAGVPVFFAISGFVLYLPYARATFGEAAWPSCRVFAVNRVARIVPAYWVVLGVIVIVGSPTFRDAVPSFLFAQNFGGWQAIVLGPAWTLTCEAAFYAFLPALAAMMVRYSLGRPLVAIRTLACLIPLGIVGRHVVSRHGQIPFALNLVSTVDLFAVGMMAAVAFAAGWRPPRFLGVAVMIMSFPFLYASPGPPHGFDPGLASICAETVFASGCGLVLVSLANATKSRLEWRPVVALGTISYGVYLWHAPSISALDWAFNLGYWTLLGATVVCTLALSAASWFLIEQPSLHIARRLNGGRSSERPVLPHRASPPVPELALAQHAEHSGDGT
jgi:peptidoglycan/LPS O-acetylase OafA/YrhL